MVIIFKGFGNHSNRLFQAIHIEAFCLEHKIKFYNPSFRNMAEYYGVKSNFFDNILCVSLRFLNKFRLINSPDFDDSESYSRIFLKKNLVLYKGWSFKAENLTKKHRGFFVGKYVLLPKYYKENALYDTLSKINRDKIAVVGVHIRRGDYKTWEGGKHYFTDDVYRKYMDRLSFLLEKSFGKQALFIVFSNEKTGFKANENVIISENEWYIDQFVMSKCDYLVGPPSTYTLWASYIGNVKYFHIRDDSGVVHLDDFICQES